MVSSIGNGIVDFGKWSLTGIANFGIHYVYPFAKSYYCTVPLGFCALTYIVDALACKYLSKDNVVRKATGWGWTAGKFLPITVPSYVFGKIFHGATHIARKHHTSKEYNELRTKFVKDWNEEKKAEWREDLKFLPVSHTISDKLLKALDVPDSQKDDYIKATTRLRCSFDAS